MDGRFLLQLKELAPISLKEMDSVSLMNRKDTKYLATCNQLESLLDVVRDKYMVLVKTSDDNRFSEYITTYFDTPERDMYIAHHNKRLTRQKVRVREYLDSGDVFFEVKRKNNHGKTKKKRIPVAGVDTLYRDGADRFLDGVALMPIPLKNMEPYVRNHFERITLVNNQKSERLTIDTGLSFQNLVTGNKFDLTGLVVIEVKRDGLCYSPIVDILRELRIKPSGFSKYCIGAALTDMSIKRNNFKMKLRKVGKLVDRKLD